MLQPTLQPGQTDGVFSRYQTRLRNRNSRVVRAPTGQTSAAQPDQSLSSGLARRASRRACGRRGRGTSARPSRRSPGVKRMQRVHWMQRVMSAMTCGPIIVRSKVGYCRFCSS